MNIRRGSALNESILAVLTEGEFLREPIGEDFFLLVEGKDDIDVIKKHYLHVASNNLGIRFLRATDDVENEEQNDEDRNGKKFVIDRYDLLKSQGKKVICLLDRDYDLYLNENFQDDKIVYYRYFELENHIFEDNICKLFVQNAYKLDTLDDYSYFIDKLLDIVEVCKSYAKLCYLRELHYKHNILSERELNAILDIIKIMPGNMMQRQDLGCANKLERITTFIEQKLRTGGLHLEDITVKIQERATTEGFRALIESSTMDVFKYGMKGKTILRSLEHFVNYIYETNPELEVAKPSGTLSNLSLRLKTEWIPLHSQDFKDVLVEINHKFANYN